MKSKIQNPKSKTNPKSKFPKFKIYFSHFIFGNSKLFRYSIFNIRISILLFCLLFMIGCEAFVRKFTRKPKEKKPEEIVLVPEDYKDTMTPEQRYREYYTFWKSWQDELIESLRENRSFKKRLDCAKQAIKNLEELRKLLIEERQKILDKYIDELIQLKDKIQQDIYGNNVNQHRLKAESIKRNVVRLFTYSEIRDYLR